MINRHTELFGDTADAFAFKNFPKLIVGYHLVYLLHFAFIINFLKSFDFRWLIAYLIIFFIYYLIPIAFYYRYSYHRLKYFLKEFLQPESKFELVFSRDLNKMILDYKEFSLIKNQKQKPNTDSVLAFVARPKDKYRLAQSKAYLNQFGRSFLIHRSAIIDEPFEKFMIYHELEHLNDRGYMNDKATIRMKTSWAIHISVFAFIVNGFLGYILLICYAIMIFGERFGRFQATREIIADNRTLHKLSEQEIKVVIPLLYRIWESNIKREEQSPSNKSLAKILTYKERINAVKSFEKESTLFRTYFGMLNAPVAIWSFCLLIGVVTSRYNSTIIDHFEIVIYVIIISILLSLYYFLLIKSTSKKIEERLLKNRVI